MDGQLPLASWSDQRSNARDIVSPDLAEVLQGLTAQQKQLSPKYFYDQRGSELFDQICELDEYYPTRTELALMRKYGPELGELVGPRPAVIEFGAGSTIKVRILLDHLTAPTAYVPVDISAEYLAQQARELRADYPLVQVLPVFADFTQPFALPANPVESRSNLIFFPGSTIGNFSRDEALDLLCLMAAEALPGGSLLIGVDLRKQPDILYAAYNDSLGVTAKFNLNVLARLNRELGANFKVDRFRHHAIYDETNGRIEMRLISLQRQRVRLAGVEILFERDEYIITEHSHKYGVEEFHDLARRAGFHPQQTWVDDQKLFSLHYLRVR